jgi:NitT/TauT family transport system permease protein
MMFKVISRYLPAAIVFILILGIWELIIQVFGIERFLLPRPTQIALSFVEQLSITTPAGLFTMKEAVGGFLIGSFLGIFVALATARWTIISESLMGFAIAINSTPILALAPIMNNWFGITNPFSKMSIVALVVFFPVMINMVRGLTLVDPPALELMRSYAASDSTILRLVRLPNALPYLFTALKVASTLSVIAAIVAEYFGGPRQALGIFISQQAALFHFTEAWAGILIACIMGILLYSLVLVIERWAIPWHVSIRDTGEEV